MMDANLHNQVLQNYARELAQAYRQPELANFAAAVARNAARAINNLLGESRDRTYEGLLMKAMMDLDNTARRGGKREWVRISIENIAAARKYLRETQMKSLVLKAAKARGLKAAPLRDLGNSPGEAVLRKLFVRIVSQLAAFERTGKQGLLRGAWVSILNLQDEAGYTKEIKRATAKLNEALAFYGQVPIEKTKATVAEARRALGG